MEESKRSRPLRLGRVAREEVDEAKLDCDVNSGVEDSELSSVPDGDGELPRGSEESLRGQVGSDDDSS